MEEQAAGWIWRLDRGLTSEEQDVFFDWIAADPRNAEALTRHRRNWKRLDRLAAWRPEHGQRPNPDLLAPARRRTWGRRVIWLPLAVAAAIVTAVAVWDQIASRLPDESQEVVALRPENRQILADGSHVKLKGAAVVTVLYSETERRVRLERGEGYFMVNQDPQRPFVVEAQGLEVRAVGTAFNVSLGHETVSVLVTQGSVRVRTPDQPDVQPTLAATLLEASQQADIALDVQAPKPEVKTVSREEIQHVLAWQHAMMTFDQRPLSAIVAELNLLNRRQLILGDDTVAAMRFSGTIRSDNVEGFVRLLEAGFGVRGEKTGTAAIVLRAQ